MIRKLLFCSAAIFLAISLNAESTTKYISYPSNADIENMTMTLNSAQKPVVVYTMNQPGGKVPERTFTTKKADALSGEQKTLKNGYQYGFDRMRISLSTLFVNNLLHVMRTTRKIYHATKTKVDHWSYSDTYTDPDGSLLYIKMESYNKLGGAMAKDDNSEYLYRTFIEDVYGQYGTFLVLERKRNSDNHWTRLFAWPVYNQIMNKIDIKVVSGKVYMCCTSVRNGNVDVVDLYCYDQHHLLGPWHIDETLHVNVHDAETRWPASVLCVDKQNSNILHIGYVKYIPASGGNFYAGIFKREFDTGTNTLLPNKKHLISDDGGIESFSMTQDNNGELWYAYTFRSAPANYLRFFKGNNSNLTTYTLKPFASANRRYNRLFPSYQDNRPRVVLAAPNNVEDKVYMAYFPAKSGAQDDSIAVETFNTTTN